jgi:hypothetical protein
MTWWYLENLIDESRLSAPCKHVLKTLCRQINPPDDWDATDPEAWDAATHPEALTVWYDRVKLSLLTSYSPDSLSRIVGQLGPPPADGPRRRPRQTPSPTYYGVVHIDEKAHQHYTARLRVDLKVLRDWRDPRIDALEHQRAEARQHRRPPRRRQGELNPHTNGHARRDEDISQRTYLTPADAPVPSPQRAYLTPSDPPDGVSYDVSVPRGRNLRPLFTSSLSRSQDVSPFLADADGDPDRPAVPPKKVAGGQPSHKTKAKSPTSKPYPVPERTPPPERLAIREELIAWRDAHAPGVSIERIRDIWLQDCHAKGYRFTDWEGELKTQLLKAYHADLERRQRHARLQGYGLERALACSGEEPSRPPDPDDAEWQYANRVYGLHRVCNTYHQRYGTCPARQAAASPQATGTGPPPEASGFHQRQVVPAAKDHGFTGLGAVLAAD